MISPVSPEIREWVREDRTEWIISDFDNIPVSPWLRERYGPQNPRLKKRFDTLVLLKLTGLPKADYQAVL